MRVQEELSIFYDDQATKYAQTREKYRSEAHLFLDEILSSPQKHLHILEFGCGSGRLLQQLTQIKDKKISYVGVDLSKKLLTIAKKQVKPSNKNLLCTFVCDDILNYIGSCKQESFDFVIGVASFQHMPSKKDRYYLLKNSYRVLVYEGKLIMSNWSLSQWFLRKYSKEMLRCLRYNALHR
ncbi:MAG: class I SAM-dependent methyltransferase [bacterium]